MQINLPYDYLKTSPGDWHSHAKAKGAGWLFHPPRIGHQNPLHPFHLASYCHRQYHRRGDGFGPGFFFDRCCGRFLAGVWRCTCICWCIYSVYPYQYPFNLYTCEYNSYQYPYKYECIYIDVYKCTYSMYISSSILSDTHDMFALYLFANESIHRSASIFRIITCTCKSERAVLGLVSILRDIVL